MNKKINLAVASAALVLGASAANAGIVIPAGEWTMDINGNVNAYASTHSADDTAVITGGTAAVKDINGEADSQGINTGLLPSWLGFTGTTRQNDLDVSFTISFQPNASDNSLTGDSKTPLNRQAFLTFGDKSWGTVKMGKDLGIFAADAILNDMTLLGVGSSAITGSQKSGGSTSLGGIGTGYIYPAWKGQVAYTTPNMNGFQATIGITNPNGSTLGGAAYQDTFGFEGKAAYDFAAGDAKGKVWVSGAAYDVTTAQVNSAAAVTSSSTFSTIGDHLSLTSTSVTGLTTVATTQTEAISAVSSVSYDATVVDIGANINLGNFGLTGYYYSGEGVGTTFFGANGATAAGIERDSDGGYVQATFVIPSGTKLGAAYGVSNLDLASGEAASALVEENKRWTVGAYHPLTKHLNLVAEYNKVEANSHNNLKAESDSFSLGAILFF